MVNRFATFVVLLCGASAAMSEPPGGIHLPADSKTVGLNWHATDGASFAWTIQVSGAFGDDGNSHYSNGMILQDNENLSLSWSGNARISKDGREIEIGPAGQRRVRVSRRIYVDPKLGYCRWIDIFENTSETALTMPVQYSYSAIYTTRTLVATSGQPQVGEKDWGCVTVFSGSPRPVIAHIFASKGAKVQPSVQLTGNSLNYNFQISIPAGKAVALCCIEAQRKSLPDAQAFLKNFSFQAELAEVPAELRNILLNMTGPGISLGSVNLPRSDENDLAVLRKGNELLGAIQNDKYVLETLCGKIELTADRVLGTTVPSGDEPFVNVALTDGQVLCGTLVSGPLVLKLASGDQMTLPATNLRTFSYRITPQRPAELTVTKPLILLRAGQRLAFRLTDLDCTFHTEYGDLKLRPQDLRSFQLDTPEGGLHRALFLNGSILSGLMTAKEFKLQLELGPTLTVRRSMMEQFLFPAPEQPPVAPTTEMTLRNDDRLLGHVADQSVAVETKYGLVAVTPNDIAEMEVLQTSRGQVQIKLLNGTTISGRLKDPAIHFQVDPGPEVPVFAGHIVRLVNTAKPPPPATPTTAPAGAAVPPPGRAAEDVLPQGLLSERPIRFLT